MEQCDSELTAHVIVKGGNGRWMLRAFGKVVEDIAEKWGGGVITSTFHSSLVVEDILRSGEVG